MTPGLFVRFCLLGLALWQPLSSARAAHVTRHEEPAKRFGVHEITLTADSTVPHPFDLDARVTFTSPEGTNQTVRAFYDGNSIWRARVYVSAEGTWQWRSESNDLASLHGHTGTFTASSSSLRGMLRKHAHNPRQWMTDNGQTFLNLSDTAYYLFSGQSLDGKPIAEQVFQDYVAQAAELNITSLRASITTLRDPDWHSYFASETHDSLNLESFQRTDARLEWLLNHYPHLYIQLILIPESNTGWKKDETFWKNLPASAKKRLLSYIIARYAAWPQVWWLIGNDYAYGDKLPNNNAQAEEWGSYFKAHDPWNHLLSTGRNRNEDAPFPEAPWNSYLHLETNAALTAPQIARHATWPLHVFNGEDQYEYPTPEAARRDDAANAGNTHQETFSPQRRLYSTHARYFYRWLFWSWLLSGGSANYGTADWNKLRPYQSTSYVGLDSVRHILPFFENRKIDIAQWTPDETRATDSESTEATHHVKALRREMSELLVYHPNAAAAGLAPVLKKSAAQLRLDLRGFPQRLAAEWFRPHDGHAESGGSIKGGELIEVTAPWEGHDVVLHLKTE